MSGVFLLVDDDDSCLLFLRHAMERTSSPAKLQYVENGRKATQYLSRQGVYADEAKFPFPSAVLLDLKMPLMNGFEVLEWIKHQPALQELRVIVWSSSDLPQDRERALALGARFFFPKPFDLAGYKDILRHLEAFPPQN
jgi:CheY-like chemotaxis protein